MKPNIASFKPRLSGSSGPGAFLQLARRTGWCVSDGHKVRLRLPWLLLGTHAPAFVGGTMDLMWMRILCVIYIAWIDFTAA